MKNCKKNITSGLSRRSFIKANALGAMAIPAIVPSSVFGKNAPSNRINMGSIGVGGKGSGNTKGFTGDSGVQMLGVCDVYKSFRDKAKEAVDEKYNNKDCKAYNDFRELIGRGDLDAVATALPDHWHAIIGIEAIRAGLHVYGEKPFTRTIKEGRAICDAVKQYGVVWQTGSQQRSDEKFRTGCELVRNGRLGKILKTEVGLAGADKSIGIMPNKPVPRGLDWDMWLGPAPWIPYHDFSDGSSGKSNRKLCHYYWRYNRDYAAGQLTNWGAHHIDIAQWGLGFERSGPVEIEGRAAFPEPGFYNSPVSFNITCKYANGQVMYIDSGKKFEKGTKWYGEKGWIYVNRGKLEASDPSILKEKIGVNDIHLYKSNSHSGNFLECIRTGNETIAPPEIGHRSCSVGLLSEISILTGRKIKWDPDKEEIIGDLQASTMLSRAYRSPWAI